MTIDLHKEDGRELVRRLASSSDVLVENFRPGVMEKWALGPKVSMCLRMLAERFAQSLDSKPLLSSGMHTMTGSCALRP